MKKPKVECLIWICISLLMCFGLVKETVVYVKKKQRHKECTREIQSMIKKHRATPILEDMYLDLLPDDVDEVTVLSIQKQAAAAKIAAVVTNGPVLFLCWVEDIKEDDGDYTLILRDDSILVPFFAVLHCEPDVAKSVAAKCKHILNTVAVVANVNSVKELIDRENVSGRDVTFTFHGDCVEVYFCGNYYTPRESELLVDN